MKKLSTKKALLASVLSMVLCMTMLIGSTFAWFTDTATVGVNTIQAGELKVQLVAADSDTELTAPLSFRDVNGNTNIYWEPGTTFRTEGFRIRSDGNLALKYKIVLNGVTGDAQLLEAIQFSIVKADGTAVEISDFEGHLAANTTSSDVLYLQGTMSKDAGNDYKGLILDGISITVMATQDTVEQDSNGNTYDENAQYPVAVDSQVAIDEAIENTAIGEKTTLALPAGTFNLTNGKAKDKNITIMGNKDTVIDVCQNLDGESGANSGMNYQDGATIFFEGVTILGQTSGNYGGIVRATTIYKDCTIKGKLTLYGDTTFINCKFENENDYSIWTWGAKNVTFDTCTFETGGKAILLYGGAGNENTHTTVMTVNNCVFNDSNNGAKGKAAIETGNDYGATYTLTVNNTTVNGFIARTSEDGRPNLIPTNSTLWANKDGMDTAHLSVTINGTKVY